LTVHFITSGYLRPFQRLFSKSTWVSLVTVFPFSTCFGTKNL